MRWDSSTAQYDMGFRTYDPGLNQFLSRDMYNGALADTGLSTDPFTGNRYTFGAGNPITNIELDGHMFPAGGGSPCTASTPGCPGYVAPVYISPDFGFNPATPHLAQLRQAYNQDLYLPLEYVNPPRALYNYANEVNRWHNVCSTSNYCPGGFKSSINKIYNTVIPAMNNAGGFSLGGLSCLLGSCNYAPVAGAIRTHYVSIHGV